MIIPRADNNPLHAPLVPILQHLLTADSAPPATRLLDLACGAGDKLPLLRSAYGADAQIVGADIDPAPLRVFGSPLPPGEGPGVRGCAVCADAHTLPFRSAVFERVFCIAALGLFDAPVQALAECHRVLRPGGRLLVATATQRWAQLVRWPDAVTQAYHAALAAGAAAPGHPDVVGPLDQQLQAAGFAQRNTRAFLLDQPDLAAAEAALLPWRTLEPLVAPQLSSATLAACHAAVTDPQIELCSLILVAWAAE